MQGATQTVHSTRPELRAAVPEDASAAVELIYLPMGKLADHLFGEDAPAKAREVLHELFEQSKEWSGQIPSWKESEFAYWIESDTGSLRKERFEQLPTINFGEVPDFVRWLAK